jgi:hypothetical protein
MGAGGVSKNRFCRMLVGELHNAHLLPENSLLPAKHTSNSACILEAMPPSGYLADRSILTGWLQWLMHQILQTPSHAMPPKRQRNKPAGL